MYFLTLCTKNRECLFGGVKNEEMILNEFGEMAKKWWQNLENKFRNIRLDEYKIMPNHLHGIIEITVGANSLPAMRVRRGRRDELPLRDRKNRRQMLLPKIVGYFKMNSAKQINQKRQTEGLLVWQRNYHEHVIRDEKSLEKIRNYIVNNPLNWETDSENPHISKLI